MPGSPDASADERDRGTGGDRVGSRSTSTASRSRSRAESSLVPDDAELVHDHRRPGPLGWSAARSLVEDDPATGEQLAAPDAPRLLTLERVGEALLAQARTWRRSPWHGRCRGRDRRRRAASGCRCRRRSARPARVEIENSSMAWSWMMFMGRSLLCWLAVWLLCWLRCSGVGCSLLGWVSWLVTGWKNEEGRRVGTRRPRCEVFRRVVTSTSLRGAGRGAWWSGRWLQPTSPAGIGDPHVPIADAERHRWRGNRRMRAWRGPNARRRDGDRDGRTRTRDARDRAPGPGGASSSSSCVPFGRAGSPAAGAGR